MPLTPLHYCVAYLINKGKRELSLPALVVSSMLPDLEKPFVFVMTGGVHSRLVLHSLLGAIMLGAFLSILLTVFLYPTIVSFLFKIDKGVVLEKCRFSVMLALASVFGCASHVLLDSLHHEFNPLLYPLLSESFDMLVLLDDWNYATILVQSVFLALFILILVREIRGGAEGFWKRALVG